MEETNLIYKLLGELPYLGIFVTFVVLLTRWFANHIKLEAEKEKEVRAVWEKLISDQRTSFVQYLEQRDKVLDAVSARMSVNLDSLSQEVKSLAVAVAKLEVRREQNDRN